MRSDQSTHQEVVAVSHSEPVDRNPAYPNKATIREKAWGSAARTRMLRIQSLMMFLAFA
ncbi:Uncharacterized protein APZ42_016176 [Daphnia magna]|uniref:Uncharacterized protein n=1 Tax=Daphnia magna TaxID=35525 RepID=A0A162NP71_9CRUS|nr:Uncharacterized protein APZ42_016176 [Daphnia magna]